LEGLEGVCSLEIEGWGGYARRIREEKDYYSKYARKRRLAQQHYKIPERRSGYVFKL